MNLPHATLSHVLLTRFDLHPQKLGMQIFEKEQWSKITYGEISNQVKKGANFFRALHVKKGSRIVLISENRPEAMIAYLAILDAGCTAVCLDASLAAKELSKIINFIDPVIVCISNNISEELFSVLPTSLIVCNIQNKLDIHSDFQKTISQENKDVDETIATILFTSGTSDFAKGVMLTHENLLVGIKEGKAAIYLTANDRVLSFMPIHHISPLMLNLVGLYAGATLSCIAKLDGSAILSGMKMTQPTCMGVVPLVLDAFNKKIEEEINKKNKFIKLILKTLFNVCKNIQERTSINIGKYIFKKIHTQFGGKLTHMVCGGAPCNPELLLKFKSYGFTIIEAYGLTETSGPICSNPFDRIKIGTVGLPFSTTKIKIISPDENGIGEIAFQSPQIMKGYFRDPETTNTILCNDWLHTGDLGQLDPDGYLKITGRLREIIVLDSGKKVIPAEVEKYYTDIPGIQELVVFGYAIDKTDGEKIHAAIVLSEQFKNEINYQQTTLEAMQAKIEDLIFSKANNIPLTLQIQYVHLIDQIPKTSTLKVKRALLPHLLHTEIKKTLSLPTALNNDVSKNMSDKMVIEQWLQQWISNKKNFPLSSIHKNKPFTYYGLSSLDHAQLAEELQHWLKLPVKLTKLWLYPTIEQLTNYLLGYDETNTAKNEEKKITSVFANEPIAIVGIGCRFPNGVNSPESFWQALLHEQRGITETPANRCNDSLSSEIGIKFGGFLHKIDVFDAQFFDTSAVEATYMDPQHRLLLTVTWEALEHGCIDPTKLNENKTGVYIGISTNDYALLQAKQTDNENITPFYCLGNTLSAAAARITSFLGIEGPCKTIDTACSSSLVAVHDACNDLRRGDCRMAIVGGVNAILSPIPSMGLTAANLLSADGECKVFEDNADGYVRSEGCGIVVLKRLSDAEKNNDTIFAVIQGSAINHSNSMSSPNIRTLMDLFQQALQTGNLISNDIQFIETHAVGTSVGDAIEVEAIKNVYTVNRPSHDTLYLGSVKRSFGHLEAASGIIGLIKTVLSLKYQTMTDQIKFKKINSLFNIQNTAIQFSKEIIPWKNNNKLRTAAVNAFGFTGTNAQILIQEFIKTKNSNVLSKPYYLITLSAKTRTALSQKITDLYQFLSTKKNISLISVSYSLNIGRTHFDERAVYIVSSVNELINFLFETIHDSNFIKSSSTNSEEKLYELAKSYVNRKNIVWQDFYEVENFEKISLPTYPFAETSYWATLDSIQNHSIKSPLLLEDLTDDSLLMHLNDYLKKIILKFMKHDPFDELKGINFNTNYIDSITASAIVAEINYQYGLSLQPSVLYEKQKDFSKYLLENNRSQIIASLTKHTNKKNKTSYTGVNENIFSSIEISLIQEKIWLLSQFYESLRHYNIPCYAKIRGSLNVKHFEDSLTRIFKRHKSLRTFFSIINQKIIGLIDNQHIPAIYFHDLIHLSTQDQQVKLNEIVKTATQNQFNFGQSPLFITHLVKTSADFHLFLLVAHHSIADAWSAKLLLQELSSTYHDHLLDKKSEDHLPLQYADFSSMQKIQTCNQSIALPHINYWKNQLANFKILQLPKDRNLTDTPDTAHHTFYLNQEHILKIYSLQKKYQCSIFTIHYTLVQILLYATTHQHDLLIGIPFLNRNYPDALNMIGCAAERLPIRCYFKGDNSINELFHQVINTLAAAYENTHDKNLSIDHILQKINYDNQPLFNIVIDYFSHQSIGEIKQGNQLTIEPIYEKSFISRMDLSWLWIIHDKSNEVYINIAYDPKYFSIERMKQLTDLYQLILNNLTIEILNVSLDNFISANHIYLDKYNHPPSIYKVIVCDCDNTLWGGACAELGAKGVIIDAAYQRFQEFLIQQVESGMLLCLSSKNNESDVFEVFQTHPNMLLKLQHISAWKINWDKKSNHLNSLAHELNLNTDSMIFIDDNPIECAEVKSKHPNVLIIQLPGDHNDFENIQDQYNNIYNFPTTHEDRQRTIFYQQEKLRKDTQQASLSFSDFISQLDLKVEIMPLIKDHMIRASQLTYRTNQFNTTTKHRKEDDIIHFCKQSNHAGLAVFVKDKFGDYGMVGLMLYSIQSSVLYVDTFLLSCRALGRGVEYHMMAYLGKISHEQQCDYMEIIYSPTPRNQPIYQFLTLLDNPLKPTLSLTEPRNLKCDINYVRNIRWKEVCSPSPIENSPSEENFTLNSRTHAWYILAMQYNPDKLLSEMKKNKFSRSIKHTKLVLPRTQTEKILASLCETELHLQQVGIHDDFFSLGISSLVFIRLLLRIQEKLSINLNYQQIIESRTIENLAHLIDETLQKPSIKSAPTSLDLKNEIVWEYPIPDINKIVNTSLNDILLTGSTGFLGAYLLNDLLNMTTSNIYCLIRASTKEEGLKRILENLRQYHLAQPITTDRIKPILANIEKPQLGISDSEFNFLAESIQSIYHIAAQVNLGYSYHSLKASNVAATKEIFKLSALHHIKPVHYVSTLAVFASLKYLTKNIIYEHSKLPDSKKVLGGYAQTKWVTENLAILLKKQGYSITIYRPGMITGDSQYGNCNLKDATSRFFKGIIDLKSIPDWSMKILNMVPVDYVSKSIATLSLQDHSQEKIYHLANPQSITLEKFVEILHKNNYEVKLESFKSWHARLQKNVLSDQNHPLYPLLPLFLGIKEDTINALNSLSYFPQPDCSQTFKELKNTPIKCPPTESLLPIYLNYFKKSVQYS